MTPSEIEDIAQDYYTFRDYRRSISTYKELIKRFGSRKERYEKQLAWAHYEVGFCHLLLNELDEAEPYFKIVLSDFSTLAALTLAEQRIEEISRLRNPEPNRIRKFFMKLSPKYRKQQRETQKSERL